MENGDAGSKPMGLFSRIGGIFMSPTETFQSVEQKPMWWVPFIISLIVVIALQFWLMDIGMKDQIDKMVAQGRPDAQIEMAQKHMQGPMRFIGLAVSPIAILVIWLLTAALLMLGSNTIMGGTAQYGQIMGVVGWSSLITLLGGILKSILVYLQGTTWGVSTSLAALMPVPPMSQKLPILYQLLSKADPFMVWQVMAWGIGLSVVAKITNKKAVTVSFGLWIIWIAISIAFSQLIGNKM